MTDFLHINLGNVLTVIAFFCGGILFVLRIREDVDMLGQRSNLQHEQNKEKFDDLGKKVERLGELILTTAKHEMRLDSVEQRQLAQAGRIDSLVNRKT